MGYRDQPSIKGMHMSFPKGNFAFIEPLESRLLFSGNVAAVVTDGDLRITGDALDNAIEVTQDDWGYVTVSGLAGTKINGSDVASLLHGVYGKISIDMRAGDDSVKIGASYLSGDLTILNGEGDNVVTLDSVMVGGNLTIKNGSGNDNVTLTDVSAINLVISNGSGENYTEIGGAFKSVSIKGGAGSDSVTMDQADVFLNVDIASGAGASNVRLTDTTVQHNMSITNGAGDDVLELTDTSVLGEMKVVNGSGSTNTQIVSSNIGLANRSQTSAFKNFLLSSTGGADTLVLQDSTIGRDMVVSFGSGGSSVTMESSTVQRDLRFTSQDGTDSIEFTGATVGRQTQIQTGKGDDAVTINDTVFTGQFALQTGAGSDRVTIEEYDVVQGQDSLTSFGSKARILLQDGDDVLRVGIGGDDRVGCADFMTLDGGKGVNLLSENLSPNLFHLVPAILNFERDA